MRAFFGVSVPTVSASLTDNTPKRRNHPQANDKLSIRSGHILKPHRYLVAFVSGEYHTIRERLCHHIDGLFSASFR
jgi:hypothetical protein